MKFKLFGTEIYISFLFMAVITLMLATDRTGMVVPTLFAISVHELSHLFAMWVLECAPTSIKLIPASVQITSPMTKRYRNDIVIAICGPLANFILFLTFFLNFLAFKNKLVLYYALINLLIGAFNALPVCGLDGGTVLKCILAKKHGPDKATVIVKIITLVIAVLIIFTAIILTVKHKFNISLFIIGIYLFIMSIIMV